LELCGNDEADQFRVESHHLGKLVGIAHARPDQAQQGFLEKV
jgi:hypothetical protein